MSVHRVETVPLRESRRTVWTRRPMHHPGKPRMGRVRRTRAATRDSMTTVYTCDPDVHWTH